MDDRERTRRRADDELDRLERANTLSDLGDSEWDRAIAVYEPIGPLMNPVIGVMEAAFRSNVRRRKERRRLDFLQQLDRAVRRLEGRIDTALGDSDTFAQILEEVSERIDRRAAHGKVQYYATALAKGLTRQAPDAVKQAAMLDVLDALRPLHLEILAVLMTERIARSEFPDLPAMIPILQRRFPQIPAHQLEGHWHDLQSHNLVPWLAEPIGRGAQSANGALIRELTPFGRRFGGWLDLQVQSEE